MNTEPLVTVGVVTYNSSEFIKEALDSVFRQTYKNIELIISDDCSTDDTVSIAEEWMNAHKDRFVRTLIISTEKNTGVSGNFNRLISQAKGVWLKGLAGDDILADTAIEDYINFINEKQKVAIVFGRMQTFSERMQTSKLMPHKPSFYPYLYDENITAKQQYNIAIKHNIATAASAFYKLKVLKYELGGFDERFPLLEDAPFFIKITKHGYKLWLLDKVTLFYRISSVSLSHSMEGDYQILSNNMIRNLVEYKYQFKYENYGIIWKLFLKYRMFLERCILKSGNSSKGLNGKLFFFAYKYINPYVWHYILYYQYLKIRHICIKSIRNS